MTRSFEDEQARSLSELSEAVCAFADERLWSQFHDPKSLAMALASEAGEMLAILRWTSSNDADSAVSAGPRRDALFAEIGDVGICLLLLCARTRIDLSEAIASKLRQNAVKYPVELSRGLAEAPRII